MIEYVPEAASDLADAGVDDIAFGCTTGSLIGGKDYNAEIIRNIENEVSKRATTTTSAVVEAPNELGLRRLSIATSYENWLNQREKESL